MKYDIKVNLTTQQVEPMFGDKEFRFGLESREDMFKLIKKINDKGSFSEEESMRLVLGLRLLGEMVMSNRSYPPLKELKPALATFIKSLKS